MWIFNRVRGYRLTQVSSNADTGCEKGKAYRSLWTLTSKNISRHGMRVDGLKPTHRYTNKTHYRSTMEVGTEYSIERLLRSLHRRIFMQCQGMRH